MAEKIKKPILVISDFDRLAKWNNQIPKGYKLAYRKRGTYFYVYAIVPLNYILSVLVKVLNHFRFTLRWWDKLWGKYEL